MELEARSRVVRKLITVRFGSIRVPVLLCVPVIHLKKALQQGGRKQYVPGGLEVPRTVRVLSLIRSLEFELRGHVRVLRTCTFVEVSLLRARASTSSRSLEVGAPRVHTLCTYVKRACIVFPSASVLRVGCCPRACLLLCCQSRIARLRLAAGPPSSFSLWESRTS